MALADTIAAVSNGEQPMLAQIKSKKTQTPFMTRLADAISYAYEDTKGKVGEGVGMVGGLGKGIVKSAVAGAASLTADPYNLITKGRPTEPINIPGIGVAKTAGRRADEYGSQVAEGDTYGMAAAGTRAFGEGLLDVATVASLAQIAKQGIQSFLGEPGSVTHTTNSVTGKGLSSGYERGIQSGEVPRELIFEQGNVLKPAYAQTRVSDAAQKLDQLSKGLGEQLTKALKDVPIEMADDGTYPQITEAAREVIRNFAITEASPVLFSAIDGLTEELDAQGHPDLSTAIGIGAGIRGGRVRYARPGELLPRRLPTVDELVTSGMSLKKAIKEQERVARLMYQQKMISRDVYQGTVRQQEMYRSGKFGK